MKPGKDVQAVIFDFDGVVAETENVHIAAWERTFSALGLDVSPEICACAVEQDDRAFLTEVLAARNVQKADIAGWVQRKQQITRMMLADNPRVYPGVAPLVERLRERGLRLAVVSGTWRENVAIVLGTSGLSDRFELIVGKEDVARTKPEPEAYQLALRRLALPPARVAALEDSPLGLESARGAGIRVIAIGHRRPAGSWTGGAPYLPDFADLDVSLALIAGRAERPAPIRP